ncbi:MAG: hypothetical protein K2M46_03100 [Lachnospiraceae bacterium]|nr:hypothetical protein [Lachnospiraceae bacterium]
MAIIGKVIDGKYEILKQIGMGGMSAIFLGITFFLGWKWNILQVLAKISRKVEQREMERLSQMRQFYGQKFDYPIKEAVSLQTTESLANTQKLSEDVIEDETCLLEKFSYIPIQQEHVDFQVTKTEISDVLVC